VQDQLREELDLIARQLLASLFYLTIRTLDNNNGGDAEICHGWIKCRLGRSYERQFQSLLRKNPAFRVIDSLGNDHNLPLVSREWDATFSIQAQFQVPKESAEVRVEMTLDNGSHWDTISGFPRYLHGHTF